MVSCLSCVLILFGMNVTFVERLSICGLFVVKFGLRIWSMLTILMFLVIVCVIRLVRLVLRIGWTMILLYLFELMTFCNCVNCVCGLFFVSNMVSFVLLLSVVFCVVASIGVL